MSLDETTNFTPKWNKDGLITAIAVDHNNNDILMVAHMNQAALKATLESGQVVYWSRSRQSLWRKGETSGHTQRLIEIYTDCDQDALILRVEQKGSACHTDRRSCFYRKVDFDPVNPEAGSTKTTDSKQLIFNDEQ